MNVVPLSCPQCGGAQDFCAGEEFVECRYCGVTLRVERTPAGELELLLAATRAENELLSLRIQKLELSRAIEKLDRKWASDRKPFLTGVGDAAVEPSSKLAQMTMLAAVICLFMALSFGLTNSEPLAGIALFCTLAVVLGISGLLSLAVARAFEQMKARYEIRRELYAKDLDVVCRREAEARNVRRGLNCVAGAHAWRPSGIAHARKQTD